MNEVRSTAIRTTLTVTALVIGILSGGTAYAQTTRTPSAPLASAPGDQTRRLTIDDAVRLPPDNNLGVQIARINPQLQDRSVALARSAWVPTFNTTVQGSSAATPNNSFLSG